MYGKSFAFPPDQKTSFFQRSHSRGKGKKETCKVFPPTPPLDPSSPLSLQSAKKSSFSSSSSSNSFLVRPESSFFAPVMQNVSPRFCTWVVSLTLLFFLLLRWRHPAAKPTNPRIGGGGGRRRSIPVFASGTPSSKFRAYCRRRFPSPVPFSITVKLTLYPYPGLLWVISPYYPLTPNSPPIRSRHYPGLLLFPLLPPPQTLFQFSAPADADEERRREPFCCGGRCQCGESKFSVNLATAPPVNLANKNFFSQFN